MRLLHRGCPCADNGGDHPGFKVKHHERWCSIGWQPVFAPEESIVFVQSHVPQVMELHTYLSMVTQLGKLTDLPTFKDKVRQQPENVNYGLVGYPVLMTADIVLYKTDIVPVGIDQAPHLEFAREIVRSFQLSL